MSKIRRLLTVRMSKQQICDHNRHRISKQCGNVLHNSKIKGEFSHRLLFLQPGKCTRWRNIFRVDLYPQISRNPRNREWKIIGSNTRIISTRKLPIIKLRLISKLIHYSSRSHAMKTLLLSITDRKEVDMDKVIVNIVTKITQVIRDHMFMVAIISILMSNLNR